MTTRINIPETLEQLNGLCSAGYAIALHIRFTAPKFLFQTYPQAWMETYSREGLVLKDPTVLWGFENAGSTRWSALRELDTEGVLDLAREFGLEYGFTVAIDDGDLRSIASFARSDSDFSAAEITQIEGLTRQLHEQTAGIDQISPEARERLKEMSIAFTRG